jgi:hypothetical protein
MSLKASIIRSFSPLSFLPAKPGKRPSRVITLFYVVGKEVKPCHFSVLSLICGMDTSAQQTDIPNIQWCQLLQIMTCCGWVGLRPSPPHTHTWQWAVYWWDDAVILSHEIDCQIGKCGLFRPHVQLFSSHFYFNFTAYVIYSNVIKRHSY